MKNAKNFGNIIHLPILKGDDNDRVIDILPPPELHLLLGPVNTLFKAMEREWTDALTWADSCHVSREALHGGQFNGNSCHALLNKLDLLRSMCRLHCLKHLQCFEAFRQVVQSCYGHRLNPDYREHIQRFKKAYLDLGIGVTPKVHAVFYHIEDFCQMHNEGLARWSEQALETVHTDFKATWAKYKVQDNHPEYASKLLCAVRDYNSKHV